MHTQYVKHLVVIVGTSDFSELVFGFSDMLYFITDSFYCNDSCYDSSKPPKYYKTDRLICDGSLGSPPK
jgi:hypothetical protein